MTSVGGYAIVGELARGGMGVVYRGHDPALGRAVAIKVIRSDLANPRLLQRFEREGQITARLDHPGILRVHASGVENGHPYLVYELVEDARPLTEHWRTLGQERRIELLRDAAEGLAHAHRQGVVHRDVKPDNILIDGDGRLRVADFGLAMDDDLERMTRTGATVGTPYYMAPEQAAGEREAIGPHTDVWALGVLLYEALTGELPFLASGLLELKVQIASGPRRPPSSVSSDVPPHLNAVCMKALRPDPSERYADAGELAADLNRCLQGEPPLAWTGRKTTGALRWLAAGLAALTLLAAVWLVSAAETEAPTPPAPAEPAGPAQEPALAAEEAVPTEDPEAAAELKAIGEERRDPVRADRLRSWLERYPNHPRASRARSMRIRAERNAPRTGRLLNIQSMAHALFAGAADRFLTWSPDDPEVRLWGLTPGGPVPQRAWAPEPTPARPALARDPLGGYLLASRQDVFRLDPESPDLHHLFEVRDLGERVRDLVASRDGQHLALYGERVLAVVDRRGDLLAKTDPGKTRVRELEFWPDGERLAYVAGDNMLSGKVFRNSAYAWRWSAPGPPLATRRLPARSEALLLFPESDEVLVGWGQVLSFHDAATLQPTPSSLQSKDVEADDVRGAIAHTVGSVKMVRRHPDGEHLISLSSSKNVPSRQSELRCWDLATRQEVGQKLTWPAHSEMFDISPDGEWLLVAGEGGQITVWWAPAVMEAE